MDPMRWDIPHPRGRRRWWRRKNGMIRTSRGRGETIWGRGKTRKKKIPKTGIMLHRVPVLILSPFSLASSAKARHQLPSSHAATLGKCSLMEGFFSWSRTINVPLTYQWSPNTSPTPPIPPNASPIAANSNARPISMPKAWAWARALGPGPCLRHGYGYWNWGDIILGGVLGGTWGVLVGCWGIVGMY